MVSSNFIHRSTKSDRLQSPRTSSTTGSPSGSISNGVLIPQNDNDSALFLETQSHGIFEKMDNIGLSKDIPIPSIERGSSEGINVLGGRTHSRTPSVSLSPPGNSDTSNPPRHEGSRRVPASIDDRLGMGELADAINDIATGSKSPSVLLRPERPNTCDDTPQQRRRSRSRSGSRTNPVPHNVADEKLPHDRFHEPNFQSAFSDAHCAMSELADVLSSSSLSHAPDSTMRRLYVEVQRLAQFRCQSTRTVGFVGDSGVGKKSPCRL